MLKIRDEIDLKELEKFGFEQSHVAVYPKKLVKVVDCENKKILEICNDNPIKNIWSGKDVNNVREIWLHDCKELKISNSKILFFVSSSFLFLFSVVRICIYRNP